MGERFDSVIEWLRGLIPPEVTDPVANTFSQVWGWIAGTAAAMPGGNMTWIVIAAAATVVALPLLVFAVWPRGGVSSVKALRPEAEMSDFRQRQLSSSFIDRLAAPFLQDLAHYARRITPGGVAHGAAGKLVQAGMSNKLSLEAFLAIKLAVAVALSVGVVVFTGSVSTTNRILFVVGGFLVGFVLPDVHVNRAAETRQDLIRRALPEMLDQLSVVIEAGLGFDTALSRIVDSSSGPLTDEFARSLHGIRLGRSRSEALQEIADRTDVAEVRQFVGAIKQADSLGVPMARIVRSQAEHMRKLKRLAAEEEAMRLPVKLTLPMVFCMLPSLFIVLIGPVVIRVMNSFG